MKESAPSSPAFGRRGQIEFEVLLLGEADEFPVVGEDAAVAIAEDTTFRASPKQGSKPWFAGEVAGAI